MPTMAKGREAKESMFAVVYVFGRHAVVAYFYHSKQRIALQRVISPIRRVRSTQLGVMYVTLRGYTIRAQFRWMCRHEI
jgi:hypothetical protein